MTRLPSIKEMFLLLEARIFKVKMKFACAVLLFLLATTVLAQKMGEVRKIERLNEKVAETTYLALLRTIFPDGKLKDKRFTFRHSIPGRASFEQNKTDAEIKEVFRDAHKTVLRSLEAVWFESERKSFLLLLAQTGYETMPAGGPKELYKLAVFRFEPEAVLIDAVTQWFLTQTGAEDAGFRDGAPFLRTNELDAFWLTEINRQSRMTTAYYRLVAIQNNRLRVVVDGLPTLRAENGGCYRLSSEIQTVTKPKLQFFVFEHEHIILGANCAGAVPPPYKKIETYNAVWDEAAKRYKLESVSSSIFKPLSPSIEIKGYDGELNVGETYGAEVECDQKRREWRLVKMPKLPAHHAYRIEWLAPDGTSPFPPLVPNAIYCRRFFQFKIISKDTSNIVPNRRWNTVYKAAVFYFR